MNFEKQISVREKALKEEKDMLLADRAKYVTTRVELSRLEYSVNEREARVLELEDSILKLKDAKKIIGGL